MPIKLKIVILILIVLSILGGIKLYRLYKPQSTAEFENDEIIYNSATTEPNKWPSIPIFRSKTLKNDYHVFQTFNNCGPASLSMALSYYGINVSQKELGEALRPYQNAKGDNDDKSVTLDEMAAKAQEYGFLTYHRTGGDLQIIQRFISNDIPVIARTWLHENDYIGHFRVIKGFSTVSREIIQDDSYEGKNLIFSMDKFNKLWEAFNYEYLVIVPKDKKELAEEILGRAVDEKYSWEKSKSTSQQQLTKDPNNVYAAFNLSVAEYYLGNYQASIDAYESVQSKLPMRMLWYQIEPILAYQKLNRYEKVFQITDQILNNHNRAFSELYIIRGEIYRDQGNETAANDEFEKAKFYNKNIKLP